jgi:hypothetical protein
MSGEKVQANQRRPFQSTPRDVIRPQTAGRGAKAVGNWVPRLTQRAFEKFGFSAATLITDWETIVGAELARYTAPERLKWPRNPGSDSGEMEHGETGRPGATLVLAVDPSRALDLQYRARQVAERINAYFGYRAVVDIRLVQVPGLSARMDARKALPIAAPRRASPPPAEVRAIADEELRNALTRMAAGLEARDSG